MEPPFNIKILQKTNKTTAFDKQTDTVNINGLFVSAIMWVVLN